MSPFRPFKSRRQPKDNRSAPATAAGQRLYVFGDVHGRHDLLIRMLKAISRDLVERETSAQPLVIGLGDYVDRGPSSKAVLQALSETRSGPPLVSLRGNHEDVLLRFLEDPGGWGEDWVSIGGASTLNAYSATSLTRNARDFTGARDELAASIDPMHLIFLQRLQTTFVSGDYLFVHAGVRTDRPLADQDVSDLLWIREGFVDRDAPFEKVVVHGHTPVREPTFGAYRINIDTGAYFSGRLTCLVLEHTDRRLLAF